MRNALPLSVLLGVGLALSACNNSSNEAAEAPEPDTTSDTSPAVEQPALDSAEAFELAFGEAGAATRRVGDFELRYEPARLVNLGSRRALISMGEMIDGCHGCSGSIAVHYLESDGDPWVVTREWLDAGGGSSFGSPASDWSVSREYLNVPVVYSEGGGTFQGYTCARGEVMALTGEGPAQVAVFPLAYSDLGTIDGETEIEGTIGAIEQGESFTVSYSGRSGWDEVSFSETYRWSGDRYELATAPDDMESC